MKKLLTKRIEIFIIYIFIYFLKALMMWLLKVFILENPFHIKKINL
jgi:hypothetical protein